MGREVRRVPLDFDWPIGKTWEGYLNPRYRKCPKCNAGYSKSYDILQSALTALMWRDDPARDPNVAVITGFLAGRPPRPPFGHDSIDMWAACKKLGELAGLPEGWAECAHCEGSGEDPRTRAASEAWSATPPPTGDGWQMWETTSEGSPMSPVFATAEELARWLTDTGASAFGTMRATYEQWLAMCRSGWAPSCVVAGGKMMSGVAATASLNQEPAS